MKFLDNNCSFFKLDSDVISRCSPFDCGNVDLNEFFTHDAINYSKELLGKSYCFTLDESPSEIVCAFTVSNDSIKTLRMPGSRRRKVTQAIPRAKRFRSYPSVLIGRLGVSIKFQRHGVGRELMDFIKSWFIDPNNKTGCRFVIVDSYNVKVSIRYYEANDFVFLFSTEDQEAEYLEKAIDNPLSTRLMYFDLKNLSTDFESEMITI